MTLGRFPTLGLSDAREAARQIFQQLAERCLGHLPGGIQRHYDMNAYSAEKREALQRWADHIDAVVAGQRGQVVPLHEARA